MENTIKITVDKAKEMFNNFISKHPNRRTDLAHMEFMLGAYGYFFLNNTRYEIY